MTPRTRRMRDLTIDDHLITVPLVWGDDADDRTVDVYATVTTREGGEDLPFLVFLQGGPGAEAPRVLTGNCRRRGWITPSNITAW